MIPSTGAVSLSGSRHFPYFSTALDLASGASSRTAQFTVELAGADQPIWFTRLAHLNLAYTFMRARDESNGYPFQTSIPTTAGNPHQLEWGTSDLERRHNVLLSAVAALPRSMELSAIGRFMSGVRYTPMVSGDVNGDGFANDRAYLFPPGSPEGDAIQRLLATVDARARECLGSQLGRIASRNSCTTPWLASLDLQLSWRRGDERIRRMTISLSAFNVLAGLDAVLHGANVRGWGQPAFPDNVLMHVASFDPNALAFSYRINERFGTPTGASSPYRIPFQLGLTVRVQTGGAP